MWFIEQAQEGVSELALAAASLEEYERELIAQLRPVIGFDTACLVWLGPRGALRHVTTLGYDQGCMRLRLLPYMSELSRGELTSFMGRRVVLDTEVIAARRRPQLTMYRELLIPNRVSCFVTNMWQTRSGTFGFHFGRCGPTSGFRSSDLQAVERLMQTVKLGQALHAAQALADARVESNWEWCARDWGLSASELETACLVAKGLRNAEIASLMHLSQNTVRNRVASIFRKAEVSTRAELVFAMTSGEPSSERRRANAEPWELFLERREPRLDGPA